LEITSIKFLPFGFRNYFSAVFLLPNDRIAQTSGDKWTIARTALLGILILSDEKEKVRMANIIVNSEMDLTTCIEHALDRAHICEFHEIIRQK